MKSVHVNWTEDALAEDLYPVRATTPLRRNYQPNNPACPRLNPARVCQVRSEPAHRKEFVSRIGDHTTRRDKDH
jgi:hypothetical protein